MEWMTIGCNNTDLSGSFISWTDSFRNKGFGLGIYRVSDETRKHSTIEVDPRTNCSLCPSPGPPALTQGVTVSIYGLSLRPLPPALAAQWVSASSHLSLAQSPPWLHLSSQSPWGSNSQLKGSLSCLLGISSWEREYDWLSSSYFTKKKKWTPCWGDTEMTGLALSSALALNSQRPGAAFSKPLSLPEVNSSIAGLWEGEGREGFR